MSYCVPLGIPHSVFLGWDEQDQDKALAWLAVQQQKCSQCGTFLDEWRDGRGFPLDPPPYEADDYRCLGCQTVAEFQDQIPQGERAVYVTLRKFDPNRP